MMKFKRTAVIFNILLIILILIFTNPIYIDSYIINDLEKYVLLDKLKDTMIQNSDLYRSDIKSFVNSLVLGESIDYTTKDKFIKTGIYHILSLSGMHIGMLYFVVNRLLSYTKNIYLQFALTTIVIVSYGIMTGLKVATLRAIIMCILAMFAKVINRSNDTLNSLSVASILILLFNKNFIYSTSFLLSTSITCGIIVYTYSLKIIFSKLFRSLLNKNENWIFLVDYIALCLSAFLVSIPINLLFFNEINPISLLTNFSVGFIIPFIYILSILTLLTGSPIFVGLSSSLVELVYSITEFFYGFDTQLLITENSFSYIDAYIVLLIFFIILQLLEHTLINTKKKEQ